MANNPRVVECSSKSPSTSKPFRIVIELFADTNGVTVENFRALCTGEKGIGKSGIPLHYKGSSIHGITPNNIWYGGDITHGNGVGGESSYGHGFTDTNFERKHDGKGILSMAANSDEDAATYGSQFMLLLTDSPDLDGEQVTFGKVVDGFDAVPVLSLVGPKTNQQNNAL